ncbi:MAG: hypothetical protein WCQ63_06005 [Methanomethylophilus sp.]
MTVKAQRGRRRYIAFSTNPALTRNDLIAGLAPWGRTYNVIQCAAGMAIVRCSPAQREACIAAVRQADSSCNPVDTSGTLRTLRDRYPALKAHIPPRPQNHVRPPQL